MENGLGFRENGGGGSCKVKRKEGAAERPMAGKIPLTEIYSHS